ncbi:hypothetical protein CRG98_016539 [Punica granatum]|uniref:Uncharacterized protein n=1 Tax=Punica granatum TaxID=22663 RepID=A0A2I0K3G5_PUNGR|nr:hypothetical protein CRG98_016539 [Punica granatum]
MGYLEKISRELQKAVNKQASKASGNEPEPSKYSPVESPSCTDLNVVSSRLACMGPNRAVWECPPSQGYVTDMREIESPLTILRPEG